MKKTVMYCLYIYAVNENFCIYKNSLFHNLMDIMLMVTAIFCNSKYVVEILGIQLLDNYVQMQNTNYDFLDSQNMKYNSNLISLRNAHILYRVISTIMSFTYCWKRLSNKFIWVILSPWWYVIEQKLY